MKYTQTISNLNQAEADQILRAIWGTCDPDNPALGSCVTEFTKDRDHIYSFIGKKAILSISIDHVQ